MQPPNIKQGDRPGKRLACAESDALASASASRRWRCHIRQNTSPAAKRIAATPAPTAMPMIAFVLRFALAGVGEPEVGDGRAEVEVEVEVDVSNHAQLLPTSHPLESHDV